MTSATLTRTGVQTAVVALASRPHIAAGATTGLAVLVSTRFVAPAVGAGLLVAAGPWLFGGARAVRAAIDLRDAVAGWTESLRDRVSTGAALHDALPRSTARVAPPLRPAVSRFADRITVGEPLDAALESLADDLADPAADMVIATLVQNVRTSGARLVSVLSERASWLRTGVADRREDFARQAEDRQAMRFAVVLTAGMLLALALLNPTYMAPYRSADGQVVLAFVTGLYGTAFVKLRRLTEFPDDPRIYAPPPATATGPTAWLAASALRLVASLGGDPHAVVDAARRRLAARGWPGAALRADLTLLRRDPAHLISEQLTGAVSGLLAGPLLAATGIATGGVALLPLWLALLGAGIGGLYPLRSLRRAARTHREEFLAATSLYLDLVAMRLAAGAGIAEAARDAAATGRGAVFARLRATLADARTSGLSDADALDRLGAETGLPELCDVADTLGNVEVSGAQAEATLREKAKSLADRRRMQALGRAGQRRHNLSTAQALIGFGFLVLIGYPALTAATAVAP